MGDSGPAHQVSIFPSSANDLHTGGILQVIHTKDCPVTWSTSVHSIRQGSQVQGTLLEEFSEGHGDVVDNEYCVSSTEGWSVEEDHIGLGGHVVCNTPSR